MDALDARALLAECAADPSKVGAIPRDALPVLAGEAAALHARIMARLVIPLETAPRPTEAEPDRLLDVEAAAEILAVDPRWLYDRSDSLPFARKLAPRTLRFSERGLRRWLESRA